MLDSDNVVDARVYRLRERVGKYFEQSLLQFFRGVDDDLSHDIQAGIAGWPAYALVHANFHRAVSSGDSHGIFSHGRRITQSG